jgi:hypothetical protein
MRCRLATRQGYIPDPTSTGGQHVYFFESEMRIFDLPEAFFPSVFAAEFAA